MSNTSRTQSSKSPAVKKAVSRKPPVKAATRTAGAALKSRRPAAKPAKATAATTARPAAPKPTRPRSAPKAAAPKVLTPEVLPPEQPAPEPDYTLSFQSIALKYCFHGQHSKPESTFRILPGTKQKRRVCSECYTKIMADRRSKVRARVV